MKLILTMMMTLLVSVSIWATTPSHYVAKLTASGGQAPSVVVLESSLNGSLVWTRISEGRYRCTLADAFDDETKVTGLREWHFVDSGGKWRLYWDDETETTGDSLILESYNGEGVLSDGVLVYTEVRIETYP